MQLIETTEDLSKFCQKLATHEFICVDLEFLREHSYFAKLCLIQVASAEESAVIDPLASDINLQSFFDLMQNQSVTKVFHSGRQDIEIIYNQSDKIPTPLFDTQIAAQAAGFGEAISYENLVSHILHIELDKSSRLSDWSKRPLSSKQLEYALSDVTHLTKIYQYLKTRLEKENRLSWIEDELNELKDAKLYQPSPQEAWKRIRHRSHNAFFLTTLRELASWREQRAIAKNTPRQSLIKDDVLLTICAAFPKDKTELAAVRGMRSDLARGKIGDEIIEVLQHTSNLKPKDYVIPPITKELPNVNTALLELLKLLLKVVAHQQKITPHMLASEEELKIFCSDNNTNPLFMTGWRYEIFGCKAEQIRRGEIAVAYDPQTHEFNFIAVSK